MSSVQPRIRIAESHDYPSCAVVYERAWNGALPGVQRSISVDEFREETKGELLLVATSDDTLSGYVSLWQPDWFIHHLYVDPTLHGVGVGGALLNFVEKWAEPEPLSLKCQLANKKAIGFYLSRGFVETEEHGTDEYGEWIGMEKKHF